MTAKDAASILPRKVVESEFQSIDDATGTFTMYALVFGNVDRGGDLIEPNAVQNIDEFIRDGFIALNHDQASLPIATIDTAIQDDHGLKLTGTFHSTPEAQKVRTIAKERMERGKSVKTSIGYTVPMDGERYERMNGRPVRHLSKMSVYEASFVNLPMNPEAEVQEVKSQTGFDQESEELMSDTAVVKALKRVLGLSTKGHYKIDGESLERMKACADKCSTAAKAFVGHHKSLKEAAEGLAASHDELNKSFKNFTSGQQQEQADDNDGPVADDEKEDLDPDDEAEAEEDEEDPDKPKAKAKGRGRKQDDEEEDQEKQARKALRNELQRRLLASRFSNL